MRLLKMLFLRISNEINYRMEKRILLKKLLGSDWTDERCLFCLRSIPENEMQARRFLVRFRDGDKDLERNQMICRQCSKYLLLKDRENLVKIYKSALRRDFPVIYNRRKFEAKCVNRINNILDNVK